jgi:hypothetical protein
MHFSNKNNPDLPASFSLSANNPRGHPLFSGKEIKSEFNWDIEWHCQICSAPLFERRKMAQSINSHCALITRELRWMYYDQPVIFG